ncbi:dTDP-4-dehydrorhamnose 3,5-epimerase family protein [Amycolatopsis sp. NPDC059090]|uniref:dTDP-4-dehydrorhamnose 3,5-epimerase family protein n=1 Tax=unclassified Amycolatopsis TaxID=2618356 RepID=UPI00366B9952
MKFKELVVSGAVQFIPDTHPDCRGVFCSPYQEQVFLDAVGRELFPVAQTNHSVSRRNTGRGIHFTVVPDGNEKYVYCARGRALDIVVDIRVGSPTFGAWDAVVLDEENSNSMYFPVGVGHAFLALEDDTTMSYMLSARYDPAKELAIAIRDPELGLPIPGDIEMILSARDATAPTLAEAKARGVLPAYGACREIERSRGGSVSFRQDLGRSETAPTSKG